jgi:hypothetical protein
MNDKRKELQVEELYLMCLIERFFGCREMEIVEFDCLKLRAWRFRLLKLRLLQASSS